MRLISNGLAARGYKGDRDDRSLKERVTNLRNLRPRREGSVNAHGRSAASGSVVGLVEPFLPIPPDNGHGVGGRAFRTARASPALSSSFAPEFSGRCSRRNSSEGLPGMTCWAVARATGSEPGRIRRRARRTARQPAHSGRRDDWTPDHAHRSRWLRSQHPAQRDDGRAVGIGGIKSADSVLALGLPEHHRVSAVEHPPLRAARAPSLRCRRTTRWTTSEDNKDNAWMSFNSGREPRTPVYFELDEGGDQGPEVLDIEATIFRLL